MAMSIGQIVGVLLSVVVFAALMGTIASNFTDLGNDTNITGAAHTLIGLGVLFVVIIFIYKLVKSVN